MARQPRVPPGRAGVLWLQHRITGAERAAALLDQKLRMLRAEEHRLVRESEDTGREWTATAGEAATWLVRAALLGGERAVVLASEPGEVRVDVVWTRTMGVRYPGRAATSHPGPAPGGPSSAGAAVLAARTAHRRAVETGVRHALAQAAVRVVQAESAATRRRLRAIDDRWLPLLHQALARTRLELDEQEHADGVRLRWARDTSSPRDVTSRGGDGHHGG